MLLMINQLKRKYGWSFFKLSGMLLLAAALLLCSISVTTAAEETVPPTSKAEEDVSNTKTVPCKGLKPFNNIDELVYQFYINLESDCLFEMSIAELEDVWGIKILDDERVKPKNFYPLSETEFFNKPYKTDKDAFYIERIQGETKAAYAKKPIPINKFTLKPTNEYFESYGALFPDGQLPKLLPMANAYYGSYKYSYQSSNHARVIRIRDSGEVEIVRISKPPIRMRVEKKPDQSQNEGSVAVAVASTNDAPCRGLKRYKNLDELLYQFYINLDSDCLFEKSVEELEKIWDTKIFDRRGMPAYEYFPYQDGPNFKDKPYTSERDAFYVEIAPRGENKSEFIINITREYHDTYYSLLPVGKYPKLLPEPETELTPPLHPSEWSERQRQEAVERPGPSIYSFYWYSSDKTRDISFTWNLGLISITIRQL